MALCFVLLNNLLQPKEELEDRKGHHSDTVKAKFHQDVKAHCALKGEPEDQKYIIKVLAYPLSILLVNLMISPWGSAPALDDNDIDINDFLIGFVEDPYEADDDIDINDFPIGPVKEPYGADEDIDVNDFLIGCVEPLACGADDSPMEDIDHAFEGQHLEPHFAVAVKEELWDDISLLNSILDLQYLKLEDELKDIMVSSHLQVASEAELSVAGISPGLVDEVLWTETDLLTDNDSITLNLYT
ncbi:uncharacterized protein LACBIDRAFT_329778 [Laccaria bicolor S238N-H82]|uniref:Predicted protein n=1 Tax=Laccaria bicolor (strain S238N-H82 / ATCC MYA-4686) TaxID=486041 RepID=B0DJ76_LACBS|nr:uncharacterized protein LACBIDRAFT_329778 [Laccaria bicolor S238N-H82]EDR05471.1 predicted protein [Laccaria bicolor S238N-H82]|eukprot:XP_001884029.1 predicted protein [Laccaria bicolor S238N-H82]